MASFKKGSFALNTGTGAQAVTGVGFQPSCVIFFANTATAQDAIGEANSWCLGAASGASNEFVMALAADDAAATMNTGKGLKNDASIYLLANGTPADDCVADFTSFGSDGFTINISDAPAAASLVHYLAFGGGVQAKVGSITAPAGAGSQSYTGVGFQPKAVIFFTSVRAAFGSAAGYNWMIGAATDSTHEWVVAGENQDAIATSDCYRANFGNASIYTLVSAIEESRADFTSMDSDGFTLNWSNGAGSAWHIGYIALAGLRAYASSYAQGVGTTTTGYTGVGFQPQALFVGMVSDTTAQLITGSVAAKVAAVDTALAQGGIGMASSDNVADSVEYQVSDTDKMSVVSTGGTVSTNQLTHFDADGFTIDTVGTGTAALNYYVAFASDGGLPKPNRNLLLGVG